MHINPEVPEFSSEVILCYIKAYALLNDWLRDIINIDISRQVSPFIDEYPRSYIGKIVEESYHPDILMLIEDYIKYNDTRNRSLDMLPVFKYLKNTFVSSLLPSVSVNARPTFHYRLPNTNFSNSSWSINQEWNRWLIVERLANNAELLKKMSSEYVDFSKKNLFFDKDKWISKTKSYLEDIL